VVGKAQETRLRVIESIFVEHSYVVLARLISADSYSLLRKAYVLLNVPDLKDPILV
jgi:hypothetical protein